MIDLVFSFAGMALTIATAAIAVFIRLSIQLARIEGKIDGMREQISDHEERLRTVELHGR